MIEKKPNIPEITKEEDIPPKENTYITLDPVKQREQDREDAKQKHSATMDKAISLMGLVLLCIFVIFAFIMCIISNNVSLTEKFISMISSAVLLIIGYLFGSKEKK
ncbi:MAG: hypothetical protein LBD46_08900 [Endomicrobium sp.]|jgi:amino acid permease|nr:hypothetical protein [Endomicrobium sp.]